MVPKAAICASDKIDENHAALHHVDAQIGVDAGQNQAGDKGRQQESQGVHVVLICTLLNERGQQVNVVIEQFEVVGDLPSRRLRKATAPTTVPPTACAMELGVRRSKYGSTRISLMFSRFIVLISSRVWLGVGGMPGLGST